MKHRFFINAKEAREYEHKVISGRISQEELDFAEADDQEIGQNQQELKEKEAAKKEAAIIRAAKLAADKNKSQKELAEEKKLADQEQKMEDAKKPSPADETGAPSPQKQGQAEGNFIPPELDPTALVQQYRKYDDYDEKW